MGTTTTTTTTSISTTTTSTTTTTTSQAAEFVVGDLGGVFAYHPQPRAGPGLVLTERAENDLVFGVLTSVGYFFITIVLMMGILMGDKQKYTMLLFNLFGFLFFLSLGSEQIDVYKNIDTGKSKAKGMGAMAIMTSFTYLVDTVFSVLEVMNGDK